MTPRRARRHHGHGARPRAATPPPSEESGGVVPMEGNGGGEGGVMADDHSAGPRLDEPRFQVGEHVIYTGEHADARERRCAYHGRL